MKKEGFISKLLTGVIVILVILIIASAGLFAYIILGEVGNENQPKKVVQTEPLKDTKVSARTYHIGQDDETKSTEELAKLKSAVIKVETDTGTGSGVIINEEGYILTNWHVIDDATDHIIIYFDGHDHAVYEDFQYAEVLAYDAELDLAVLKIEEIPQRLNIKYIPLGDRGGIGVGQEVVTIGSPKGFMNTISEGIISAIREDVSNTDIQVTASLSVGSSGGALINKKGHLIGITTYKIRDGENLNFAISIGDIMDFLDQNIAKDYNGFKAKKQPIAEFTLRDAEQNENYDAFVFSDNEIKGSVGKEENLSILELGESYLSGHYKVAFKNKHTDIFKIEPVPFCQIHHNYELDIQMQMSFYEGRNQIFDLKSQESDEIGMVVICTQSLDQSWVFGILSIIDGVVDSWGIEENDGWIDYTKGANYIRRVDGHTIEIIWKTENGYFSNKYTLNSEYQLFQAFDEDIKINDINGYIQNGGWIELGGRN